MNEIIAKDDVDQLKFILNHVKGQSYIDCVHEVQDFVKNELENIEVPLINYFAPNVYMRQINVNAGTLIVSKMHKTEHFLIMLKGSMTVLNDDGIEFIEAPKVIKTKIGTKRVIYFHEDSSLMTVHPTQETDLDKIEEQLIVPYEQEKLFLESQGDLKCLG